jgi:hypothetical protein
MSVLLDLRDVDDPSIVRHRAPRLEQSGHPLAPPLASAQNGTQPTGGITMRAAVGDRIVVQGTHVGEHARDGEVLEVHGADGGPPFLVRWSDSGHESLFFPGPDATVQHYQH